MGDCLKAVLQERKWISRHSGDGCGAVGEDDVQI